MLKVNLETELMRQNRSLVSAKELLMIQEFDKMGELTESDALTRVFNTTAAKRGKELANKVLTKKEQAKSFDQSRVFHISQIEKLCKKYYLKFLPTSYFKGSIDKETAGKIEQFEIANGIQITPWQKVENPFSNPEWFGGSTFIAAPRSSFSLEKRPKDPLLFHQINDEYFYLIHKWGNDVSLFRRVKAWIAKDYTILLLLPVFPVMIWLLTDNRISILPSNSDYRSFYE